jgi:iron(II)-dependent oxidoreductase
MLDVRLTWTNPKDGAVYVYVPAGEFLMGSTEEQIEAAFKECQQFRSDCQREWFTNEMPQHIVMQDAFWIMQTEVTNAQYQKCVVANACPTPTSDTWKKDGYAQHPVTHVNWQQANAYATWTGGQLPTEAQWEKAARGPNGRIYPWRGEWKNMRANYCDKTCTLDWKDATGDDRYALTAPVGNYPAGASFYETYDMAGNVWEWTSTVWGGCNVTAGFGYPYNSTDGRENPDDTGCRVIRGGSFKRERALARCAYRVGNRPDSRYDNVGFRVVRHETAREN